MPPMKIGLVVDSGRYTPTANASELTPDISSTSAIITPSSTSPQGSSRLRMPLMMYDISVAFGRVELRHLAQPVRRVAMRAVDAGIDEVDRRSARVDQVLAGRAAVERLLVPDQVLRARVGPPGRVSVAGSTRSVAGKFSTSRSAAPAPPSTGSLLMRGT